MNTFYGVYPWKSPKSVVESADALKGPTDLTEIILLMEENRHKLIVVYSLSHDLQGFIHPS